MGRTIRRRSVLTSRSGARWLNRWPATTQTGASIAVTSLDQAEPSARAVRIFAASWLKACHRFTLIRFGVPGWRRRFQCGEDFRRLKVERFFFIGVLSA